MEKIKIAFFDTKPYDKKFFDEINANYNYEIKYFDVHLNSDTIKLIDDVNVICAFVNDIIDENVILHAKSKGVKVIALRCAGYNNVDLKTAYKNINVLRVPAYSPYAVAEHALTLIMTLNRKTHRAYYRTRDGNFSINGFLGFDMKGKTIGIVGTGKIGQTLAKIVEGLDMNVLLYDKYPNLEFEKNNPVKYVTLDELYSKSDIISLHCPLTPDTHYMINANSIAKMKDNVMIINTGRGQLVNTKDLITALKEKRIGAAGLDVYEEESDYFFEDFSSSMINDDTLARLLTFPNVLVTSHQAFFTKEALENIATTTLENIKEFFVGGYLKNEICYKCNEKECNKKKEKRCF